jgi:hypothetical protein
VFVPLAKWPMLMTGNYRCVLDTEVRPIRDAVHSDPAASREAPGRRSDASTQHTRRSEPARASDLA